MSQEPNDIELDKALTELLEDRVGASTVLVLDYLEEVIDATKWPHEGVYREKKDGPYHCPHCHEAVSIPASHNTRIAAARTLKEWLLDKVKGNKKDRTLKEKAVDFEESVREAAQAWRDKEARAEKAGKLARMPEQPDKKRGGGLKLKALKKKGQKKG